MPRSKLCPWFLLAAALAGLTAVRAAVPPHSQPAPAAWPFTSPTRTTLDLAGEWRFALDPAAEQRTGGATGPTDARPLPPGDGIAQEWFKRDLTDKIRLPGILQAQGYGNDIATDTPWVLTLGDAWWKLQPAALRAHFSQPGHVEVPFLAQPPKHYLGVAWYQRDIEIDPTQQGRHFVLFLERAHWQTTVWLDDRAFPANDSLVAPHVTDLGLVAPGKHRLTIRVDNRTQLPAAGHLVDGHAVSDGLGAAWNGIVGRIELQSTPAVWIEDMQAFPNVAKGTVLLKVKIGNATGKPGFGRLGTRDSFDNSTMWGFAHGELQVQWTADGGTAELELFTRTPTGIQGIAANGKSTMEQPLWDEFDPKSIELSLGLFMEQPIDAESTLKHPDSSNKGLLTSPGASSSPSPLSLAGEIEPPKLNGVPPPSIADKDLMDARDLVVGLREVTTSGKDLLVNGRPVNLRLTHFGGDFPLTGYPAMDVPSWEKIIQACKDHGLNGIRFHSWCPPEAAFTAADELGFYLQPECGMWNTLSPGTPMARRLEDETARLVQAYGNHPSFLLLSPSNEPSGRYQQVTPQWAAAWYAKDNRRLYSAGTGWTDPAQVTGGAQFATLVRYGNGQLRNTTGWFGKDYGAALTNVNIPVLAHEVGQWCAYPDFDVMKKFTGYLQPGNYDIFKYIADQNGVLDENHALANASGKFQLACYKEEIEANLRTPGLAGFQLLDLHDYLGQGTALIGVLDAFWESKGYVTPAEFRRFAGATVPLARLAKRTFTTAETLECPVELYNFGDQPLPAATPYWKITDAAGHTVAGGQWEQRNFPRGKNIPLGQVSANLAALPAPGAYKLVAGVGGTSFENDWNFWLYPAPAASTDTPADVLVTSAWPEAETRLAAGGKVLFMPRAADLDAAKSPPMKDVPVFWNIQMTVRPPNNPAPKFDAMLGLLCAAAHPALAEFPTAVSCDWQWTPLVNNVRSVNLTGAPRELRPIVAAIDDWNRNWRLGVIFECKVGPGRLLVSAINLDNARGGPGLQQLRRSLLDYMGGEKFQPAATLTTAQVRSLWTAEATPATPVPARAFDPDLNDGTVPVPPTAK